MVIPLLQVPDHYHYRNELPYLAREAVSCAEHQLAMGIHTLGLIAFSPHKMPEGKLQSDRPCMYKSTPSGLELEPVPLIIMAMEL